MTRQEQMVLWNKLCNNKLPQDAIRERLGAGGMRLQYISGTYTINKLNEIFGLCWCSDVIDKTCTYGPVLTEFRKKPTKQNPNPETYKQYVTAHEASVKISIVLDGVVVSYKSGVGAGSGRHNDPDKALESSAKEAETDALKRAAYKFGNALGLALYPDGDEPYRMIGSSLYNEDGTLSDLGVLYESVKQAKTLEELKAVAAEIKGQLGVTVLTDKDENDLRQAWSERRNALMKDAKNGSKKKETKAIVKQIIEPEEVPPLEEYEHMEEAS